MHQIMRWEILKDMRTHVKTMLLIIGLYLMALALYCFFYYQNTRNHMIEGIDQKLTSAIYATQAILGPNFHDLAVDENSISEEQDLELGKKLFQFAQNIGVKYVYSFKKFNEKILFVVSSATQQEIDSGTYQPVYFTQYPEMDSAIEQVFHDKTIQHAEYRDRWGSFRSLFVPFITQSGETYVIGADVALEEVESVIFTSIAKTLVAVFVLSLLLLPLMFLLIRSKHKEWQAKFQSMFVDDLTGLPNRKQLMHDLNDSEDTHLALIDIKRFSDVTNLYGPALGDHIIKQFACRLNSFYHPDLINYRAYRVDGDVFAIIENQSLSVQEVKAGSEKLIKHLTQHNYQVSNTQYVKLEITIGGVNQSEDAFVLANMALQQAKKTNVESFVYDSRSESLPKIYQQNSLLKQQLRLALDEDRMVPFFQPIIRASNHKVAKYECLARIVDHQGEVQLTPDVFLPVARQTRLYAEITQRMVMKSIQAAKAGDFIISINLSISDIMDGVTRHFLLQTVKESKIAHRIQFEILETEAIQDRNKVLNFIKNIQSLGSKIGIDDLGRSYSNYDRLSFLPVDFIKIDGSIITTIVKDKEAQSVTKQIVEIAHRKNIKVTAEYCFDEATTQMAVELGVDYLQGFYLGKPSKNTQQAKQRKFA